MGIVLDQLPVKDPDLVRVQLAVAAAFEKVPSVPAPNVVTVTADYKVTGAEDALHVNASAGPVKITMLSPAASNRPLIVKQINPTAPGAKQNQVTLATADGSKTIAGASTFALDPSGTGSVSITADNQQHWPTSGAGGNPPTPPPGGLVYIGIPPIYVSGNVISFKGSPLPPPVAPVVPWVAPVPFGNQNTFISNSVGTEAWAGEVMVDFTGAPGTVTAYLWFEAEDTAGGGILGVRVGSTAQRAIDGALVISAPVVSTGFVGLSLAVPIASPIGLQRVTLTTKSTNTNKLTATGVNLQFR